MDEAPVPHKFPEMNATENQTVVASFISFLRQQNISEEHTEGIESKSVLLLNILNSSFSRYSVLK